MNEIQLISGNANRPLASEIATCLDIKLCNTEVKCFADGEIYVQVSENVRGADTFIVQPTCPPADRHLMELILMIDALRRASARRITAVMPYYGYARQDRKDKSRVAISARVVADLIESQGVHRVLALDLHVAQIQGFFKVPVDHLYASPVFGKLYEGRNIPDITVVSPDAGGVERARGFAKRINAPLAIIDKRRERANESEVMNIIGDVRDRRCILVDDLVDTAGSLVKGADALMKAGAISVSACASHAVLSGSAVDRISNSCLDEVIFTNSIPLKEEATRCEKIKSLSIAPLIARAIQSIHKEQSVSTLFV